MNQLKENNMWYSKSRNILIILLIPLSTNCNVQKIKDCHCLAKQEKIKAFESFEVAKKDEFPGGDASLILYLAKNTQYKEADSLESLKTTFYARFVIDTCGIVKNLCIMRPVYPNRLTETEKEFLRVISEMSAWIPAENKGKKVAVRLMLQIRFELQ